MRKIISCLLLVSFCHAIQAQKKDTIRINATHINTNVLKEGTHRYLVYFKQGKDAPRSQTQFWTRTIERTEQAGKPVIKITQLWEYKDSVWHTVTSVCDAKSFQPITNESWWKATPLTTVDMEKKQVMVNNVALSDADTAKRNQTIWSSFKTVGDKYVLNWHLDLEVFPTLPFKTGVTFLIPFYDPGTVVPVMEVAYTVTGTATLSGYDNQQVDCWIMEHESAGNKEVFWISKKTKEVLKLEQEVNGKVYRYKIKLGFSV